MTTYIIKKTDTHTLCEIADGTANTTSSSLVLFGKNYAGYGPQLDENFVRMLENFNFSSPPLHPLNGQLWWDSTNKVLKVFTLSEWKVVSGPAMSIAPPSAPNVGELWWNSDTQQLSAYDGASWKLIGPLFNASQGASGPIVATVTNATDQSTRNVITFVINNVVVSVLSLGPTFATNDISGFAEIKPGFNLPTINGIYNGDSENSLKLGNILAANFLRSDVISTTNFKFNVKNNDGIDIGLNNDFTINVDGSAVKLSNNVTGRNTEFYVNSSSSIPVLALRIDSGTGAVSIPYTPTTSLGVTNKGYVDSSITAASSNYLLTNGGNLVQGNLLPGVTNTYSLGTTNARFRNIYTKDFFGDSITANAGIFQSIQITASGGSPDSVVTKDYVDNADTAIGVITDGKLVALRNQLVGAAPSNMSTMGQLSDALGDNPSFAANMLEQMTTLAPINSPNFTGTPMAPTLPVTDTSNKIASTAFVKTVTNNPVVSSITPANSTVDIGSAGLSFRTIYGTAMRANYADLAENYVADAYYPPGTVLDFGGEKEVTLSTGKDLTKVAGVVSSTPAYLMNAGCEGEFVVAIALQGRVPCRVIGQVAKGDLLVSYGGGLARRHLNPAVGTVIGKALQVHAGEESMIEVVVGRN